MNDDMAQYVCSLVLQGMNEKNIDINDSRLLIMGYTFKEGVLEIHKLRILLKFFLSQILMLIFMTHGFQKKLSTKIKNSLLKL